MWFESQEPTWPHKAHDSYEKSKLIWYELETELENPMTISHFE
jgi:hypothetical protein